MYETAPAPAGVSQNKRKCQQLTIEIQPLKEVFVPTSTITYDISLADVLSVIKTYGRYDRLIGEPSEAEKIEECDSFAEFLPSPEGEPSMALSWSAESHSMRDIKFKGERKNLIPQPSTPYDTFRLILTDQLLDLVVRETNINAQKMFANQSPVPPQSIPRSWTDLDRNELITFLGLVLHMGTLRQTQIADYWKTNYLFKTPCFNMLMSRNRFMLIMKCLSYASDLTIRPVRNYTRGKAGEIIVAKSFIDYFNERMQTLYSPDRNLIIDESMVLCKGKTFFRGDIKGKSLPGGARLCVLSDTEGIAMKIRLFGGISRDKNPIEEVVLSLLEDKLELGHCVYMGHQFNSYNLAAKLLERDTYCTGTLKKNNKDLPKELNTELEFGDNKSLFLNGVHVGKWKQRIPVLYISTEFGDTSEAFNTNTGQIVMKPTAVVEYRKVISKVNLQDLMLSYYPLQYQKPGWHKKLFFHILQMSLNNAYLLHTMNHPVTADKKSLYRFRLDILEKMLPCPPKIHASIDGMRVKHVLTKIENFRFREKTKPNGVCTYRECVRKTCRVCLASKKRIWTLYESPGYCLECFFLVHK